MRGLPLILVTAIAVALAVTVGVLEQRPSAAPPLVASPGDVLDRVLGEGAPAGETGVLPGGATAFDEEHAGIAMLDPALLQAVRAATEAAAEDGIAMHITSGWRSAAYQEQLLREAVAEYGSIEEAARWVATATTSSHVTGEAVDVGPYDAMDWLAQHGAALGLCQTYANEPWHYELRPEAVAEGCPAPYPDPTHDPRLQR